MDQRTKHLDLLADYVIERMHALCKEAVREGIGRHEAAKLIGVQPERKPGDDPCDFGHLHYADDLLCDVIGHIQSRWERFKEAESKPPPYAPVFDDYGEFD